MDAIVSYGFLAVMLFAAVQWVKRQADARKINPLLILAVLSLLGGMTYAALIGIGFWAALVRWFGIVAPVANLIYTVLAEISKAQTGVNKLSQNAA